MAARSTLLARLLLMLAVALPTATSDSLCDKCRCTDKPASSIRKMAVVDCSSSGLESIIQEAGDWPYQLQGNDTPSVLMDAKFDRNSLTHLQPLPAVPISKLSFSHNHIVSMEDDTFLGPSVYLEEIDLSSNRLTSTAIQPDVFRGGYAPDKYQPLPKLRVLRLGRNALHSLNPDIFEHLPALEELYLDYNPMPVLDIPTVRAIATVVNLKVLDLSNTGLSTLPDTFLHTPRFLERLDISGNEMSKIPSTLGQAKELRSLVLDGNPIRRLHNESFPPLPKLRSLSISRMLELEVIEGRALGGMPSLQELYCSQNPRLMDIDTYAMYNPSEDDQPLTTLILNNNHLSYLSRHLVTRWDKLEKVALHANPWSCDCINQWMVTDLAPILEKLDPDMLSRMMCYEPKEMAGQTLKDIVFRAPHLRCLDRDGNHPEGDGVMLIGVLLGVIFAIPVTLTLFVAWRKREYIFGLCCPGQATTSPGRFPGHGAADYSRAFYKRADSPAVGDI